MEELEKISDHDKIFLIDRFTKLDNLFSLSGQSELIITFDFESHKLLLEKNIKHEISDIFLTDYNLSSIQNNSYKYAKWFENQNFSRLLMSDGINLGESSKIEFHYFLLPFLKKFLEIKNITNQYPNSKFLAAGILNDIAKQFVKNIDIIEKSSSESLLYDHVNLSLQIGSHLLKLHIPSKYYNSFKNFIEIIFNVMFGPKRRFVKNKKSILFVESNTMTYEEFLLEFKNSGMNLMLFNSRRPYAWNARTFLTLLKSKCIILQNKTDSNNDHNSKQMMFDFETLWKNESAFESFFTLNGVSFWNVIKPVLTLLVEKTIKQALITIQYSNHILDTYKPSTLLVFNETGFYEQILVPLCKKRSMRIYVVQHGSLGVDGDIAKEEFLFFGGLPIISDRILAWGESTKNTCIEFGVDKNKISIVGSLMHREFFEAKQAAKDQNEGYILLAAVSPSNDNLINDLLIEKKQKYEEFIVQTCEISRKLGKKLVIKTHPKQNEYDISHLIKKFQSSVEVVRQGDILDLISKCDVFLCTDFSTTIIEAHILEKPTIVISVKDYLHDSEVYRSKSCIRCDVNDLEKNLSDLFSDQNLREDLIKRGNDVVIRYFANQTNACKNTVDFLRTN